MNTKTDESILLNESFLLSFNSLLELSGLTHVDLQILIECGAIVPNQTIVNVHLSEQKFNSHYLVLIRQLVRLRQDFEISNDSIGLTFIFLERIRTLELQLKQLNSVNNDYL